MALCIQSEFGDSKQRNRILIIDDEQDTAFTLQMALEQYGFKTDTYTDPVLAYQDFRDSIYDLVILDIKMPGIDGFHLYQKIRMTDSKVKICFLTATEFFREQIRKEYGLGNYKQELFLRKPVEIMDLIHATRRSLESVIRDA